jgi:hypothetical protein
MRDESTVWKEWLAWARQARASLEGGRGLLLPRDARTARFIAEQARSHLETHRSLAEQGRKLLAEYLDLARRKSNPD